MIVIVKNKETEEKEAYFDIDRIINETAFVKSELFILEGYDKDANPRAKLFYKKAYEIAEVKNDMYSTSDEELVKEMLQEKQIKIYNCL